MKISATGDSMQSRIGRLSGTGMENRRGETSRGPLVLRKKAHASFLEGADCRAYWEGLVFIDGVPSGETSVRAFIDELGRSRIEDACRLLKGIFLLVVESRKNGDIHVFVDNAGLYQAFHTSDTVSNSFLELVRHEGCGVKDLSPEGVAEFLHFGWLYSHRTYFEAISRVRRDEILRVSRGGEKIKITFLRKSGLDLDARPFPPPESIGEYFRKLALSLGNCNVSVDLTGGNDTRLVAVMLDHFGLPFETASSGGAEEYEDVSYGKKVAAALGHGFFGTIQSISSLERDINEVFHATEGLYDVLYYHRLYQLQDARRKRGVDTMISGVGGELFKDFWWLQDFPFYSRKASNIERFVNMRVMPFEPMSGILAEPYAGASANLKGNLKAALSRYVLDTNTRTYDNIFYNVILGGVAGRILTSHGNYLKCFAPFLDLDLARMGFNLKTGWRCYNLFHRKAITEISPRLAALATTENGMSVSYEMAHMLRDLPRLFDDRMRRLLIKLKITRRQEFKTLNSPDFIPRVRAMGIMGGALEVLKEAGIAGGNIELKHLEDKYLGAFLSLGMLIKRIW